MAGKNKDASLNKRAFTSGFFFILAQLFARGLTFAVTPIYSRLLTQAQYGIVRTYESWLLILKRIIMDMYQAYIHYLTSQSHFSLESA